MDDAEKLAYLAKTTVDLLADLANATADIHAKAPPELRNDLAGLHGAMEKQHKFLLGVIDGIRTRPALPHEVTIH